MATFQNPQTWIGHNTRRYHNLNALAHSLPYISSDTCLVLGYLQRVTTRYHHFFLLKRYIFSMDLTVTHGNALQISLFPAKLRENLW